MLRLSSATSSTRPLCCEWCGRDKASGHVELIAQRDGNLQCDRCARLPFLLQNLSLKSMCRLLLVPLGCPIQGPKRQLEKMLQAMRCESCRVHAVAVEWREGVVPSSASWPKGFVCVPRKGKHYPGGKWRCWKCIRREVVDLAYLKMVSQRNSKSLGQS